MLPFSPLSRLYPRAHLFLITPTGALSIPTPGETLSKRGRDLRREEQKEIDIFSGSADGRAALVRFVSIRDARTNGMRQSIYARINDRTSGE